MTMDCKQFRVEPDEKVDLAARPTEVKPFYDSHKAYRRRIAEHVAELTEQQSLLYSNNTHSLLLIFQGMDTAGKDSCIKHVMSGVNPQGCRGVQLQASQRRRTGARLSLANDAAPARTRPHRYFQSVVL